MFGTWKRRAIVLASLAAVFASAGSSARAQSSEQLCFNASQNPDNGEPWGVACYGSEWAYANITVTPTSDDAGDIAIHVTEHGECFGDQHMECMFSTNPSNNVCLPEGEFETSYTGHVPYLFLLCRCFSADDPCENVE